jgi:hypothetical protein
MLADLARHVADRCSVPVEESTGETAPRVKATSMFISTVRDEDTFDRPDQPANSRITVDRRPEGLTLVRVPPGVGALRWLGVTMPLVLVVLLVGLGNGGALWPHSISLVASVLLLAASIVYIIHASKRWTIVAVSNEGLSVLTTGGLLRPRERHWARADIEAVRIGPVGSGRQDNGRLELIVFLISGKKQILFAGRDKDELAWLATVLRRQLHVPPVARELVPR